MYETSTKLTAKKRNYICSYERKSLQPFTKPLKVSRSNNLNFLWASITTCITGIAIKTTLRVSFIAGDCSRILASLTGWSKLRFAEDSTVDWWAWSNGRCKACLRHKRNSRGLAWIQSTCFQKPPCERISSTEISGRQMQPA